MNKVSAVFVVLLSVVSVAAQNHTVTIEQLLSAPFPTELTAAPTGGKIAWVQNAQGVRNLWIAEPPEYRGRQITKYDRDDGQELNSLDWTPDTKTIVYVRGGAANRQGEVPNPTSDPASVEQSIWRVSADGGEPVRIGQGNEPAISPRGDSLVFIRKGQIYLAWLDGRKEPVQLINARGNARSLRWSSDGSKLAFVSDRGDHSFIGVYDTATKTLRFLEPSVDRDGDPAWSLDGSRIAFIRRPASTKIANFQPSRSDQPWSIVVADVATARGKMIWRAEEGAGSAFRSVVAENQLLWSAEDRLVFPWERDEWTHLYSIPAQGGTPTLLTPGAFEVEYVTLSPDRRQILFNSNQVDIDRRHLWKVAVTSGRPVPVTQGKGIEWLSALTSDGKAMAFLRSGARKPAHAAILLGTGDTRELAAGTIPADFPERELVEPEPITFAAADGMPIPGQLFLPPNIPKGERRPAIIFFHGGSRRQMLLGWNYLDYYHLNFAR